MTEQVFEEERRFQFGIQYFHFSLENLQLSNDKSARYIYLPTRRLVPAAMNLESQAILQPLAALLGTLANLFQALQANFGKGSHQGRNGTKVKVRVSLHLLLHAIGKENKGQVENGTGMATIHDARQGHSALHGGNEGFQDVVVAEHTSLGVIQRTKGFVHTVFFVSIIVTNGATVSGVVDKASVTGLRLASQVLEG